MIRTLRIPFSICIAALLSFPALLAAPKPITNIYTSFPGATVQFDYDLSDTLLYNPLANYQIIYRDTATSVWNSASMSLLYKACTSATMSTIVNFTPPSGTMEYYYHVESDSVVASQSPKNVSNTFPAPSQLLADMGSDPTRDTVNALGRWLDITGCKMSYSDTKIYFQLSNAGGGFPTNSGLTTYFLYSIGIVSPDQSDSVGYAVIYISVPLLFSPGLYKINPLDTSFTKIGNITTNISGNSLNISCNASDLTAQPGFGTWPPVSGFVLTAPLTATENLTGSLSVNDIGKPGIFLPESQFLSFGIANNPPALTSATATAIFPNQISASITYTDADAHSATLREFILESVSHGMTSCTKSYLAGSEFKAAVTAATTGWYHYNFRFSDGKDTVVTAPDSLFVTIYVPGDADGNGMVNISDAVFLISYIFAGGAAPNPLAVGDENCDAIVNISDAVYLISFIFGGGPAPCGS